MNTAKIIDFLTSKNVEEYYKIYKETQWFTKSEMEEFQFVKFKKLVEHCFQNVPYYRKIMHEREILPGQIQSLNDLNLFPILTKEIIQANYADFTPLNIKEIKGVKLGQTGGTTGNILFKRTDANTRSSTWAAYKRYEDWMELDDRYSTLRIMGGHVIGLQITSKIRELVYNLISNTTSFSPYDTSEKNILKIINALQSNNFNLIRSYTQFLFFLAQRLKSESKQFKVGAISTTAEPLLDMHRNLFRYIFNAETFDQYGFGETGGVAFECNQHQGLHIAHERVVVEVNKNKDLLITDLDNYSMPFIRYWNADQAIFNDKICSCGRQSTLIKQILGRTCDYISGINGEFLHWAYFWHLLFDSNVAKKRSIKKFQIVQENKDELKIRLVSEKLNNKEEKELSSNIQSRLGRINIYYSYEQDIENAPSGKYRPVVNKLL